MQTLQQFCLRWNNHQPNFISVFTSLLNHETLVDVTIACEGKHLQAHRVVLSACSSYFQSLFMANPCQHPIVILKDIKFHDLKTMVDFMYYGEVNVSQDQLPAILKIAEMLKIKGLADMPDQSSMIKSQSTSSDKADLLTPGDSNWGSTELRSPSPMSPSARRKRLRKSSTGSGSGSTERTSEEMGQESGPHIKVESLDDRQRSLSRQSLRNSNQEPSTDSEPKDGSQDSGTEDQVSRVSIESSRQPSHERLTYPDKRQLSSESRQASFEARQASFETRQASFENRQVSTDSRQASFEIRQLSHESRQGSFDNRAPTCHPTVEDRQGSHESHLSHESSIESLSAEEAIAASLSPSPGQGKVGTKRGRLLMRQSRIKKESDTHTSPDSEPSSPGFGPGLLSLPTRIERQRSEPANPSSPLSASCNLLTVPQPTFLVKQHSSPLLPSQASPPVTPLLQRQSGTHTLQLKPIASLQTTDTDSNRAPSPSVMPENVPIVRIISDETARTNSGLKYRVSEPPPVSLETSRSGHCPALRSGPALGCNFCWNTIDAHGRILRRKTKYHCPECQTNLCIVPCFQEYHQRLTPTSHVKQDPLTTHLAPS